MYDARLTSYHSYDEGFTTIREKMNKITEVDEEEENQNFMSHSSKHDYLTKRSKTEKEDSNEDFNEEGLNTDENENPGHHHHMRRSTLHNAGLLSQKSKEDESESPNVRIDEDKTSLSGVNENKVISVSRVSHIMPNCFRVCPR